MADFENIFAEINSNLKQVDSVLQPGGSTNVKSFLNTVSNDGRAVRGLDDRVQMADGVQDIAELSHDMSLAIKSGQAQSFVNPKNIPLTIPNKTVTPELLAGFLNAESNFNPGAIGPETKYGQAKGIAQFIDSTGQQIYGQLYKDEEYNPFDLDKGVRAGATYMSQLLAKYDGDTRTSVAAYNWGPGNMDKALKQVYKERYDSNYDPKIDGPIKPSQVSWYDVLEKLPSETKKYVAKIMGDVGATASDAFEIAGAAGAVEKTGRAALERVAAPLVGLGDSASLSASDEMAGVALSKLGLSENYDEGVEQARNVQDYLERKYPYLYKPAKGVGYVLGSAKELLLQGGKAALKKGGVELGEEIAKRSVMGGIRSGAKIGALEAGVEGFAGGEGGLINRAAGGGIGAITGGGIGGTIGGVSNKAMSLIEDVPVLNKTAQKLTKIFGTKTEADLAKTTQDLEEGTNLLTVGGDKARSVGEELAQDIRYGDEIIKPAAKNVVKTEQAKIPNILGPVAKTNTEAAQAASDAFAAAGKRANDTRRGIGNAVYNDAKAALQKAPTGKAKKATAGLVDASGNPIASAGKAKLPPGYPTEVPIFNPRGKVGKALKDPAIAEIAAKNRADNAIGAGLHPKTSFDVVQATIQDLRDLAESEIRGSKHNYAVAYEKLKQAAYDENNAFRIADEAYATSSEVVKATSGTKAIKDIVRVGNEEKSKNVTKAVNNLFATDEKKLADSLAILSKEEKEVVKDAVRTHIVENTAPTVLKDTPKKAIAFIDKLDAPKLNTIFGEKEGNRIVSQLKKVRDTMQSAQDLVDSGSKKVVEKGNAVANAAVDIVPGAAKKLSFTRSALHALRNFVTKGSTQDITRKEADEMSKILLDKKTGLDYLNRLQGQFKGDKEASARVRQVKKILNNRNTGSASRALSDHFVGDNKLSRD